MRNRIYKKTEREFQKLAKDVNSFFEIYAKQGVLDYLVQSDPDTLELLKSRLDKTIAPHGYNYNFCKVYAEKENSKLIFKININLKKY